MAAIQDQEEKTSLREMPHTIPEYERVYVEDRRDRRSPELFRKLEGREHGMRLM